MDDKLKHILESGILEEYVLGLTSEQQSEEIAQYIQDHETVRKAYEEIQISLENLAKVNAVSPPESLKTRILDSIDEAPQAIVTKPANSMWKTLAALSGIAAIGLLLFSVFNWNKNNELQNNLDQNTAALEELKVDCDEKTATISSLQDKLLMINSPDTERIKLSGNDLSPGFMTYAYWNEEEKQSMVHVVSKPDLENKQCYQMWADVDGEMISLGVLNSDAGELVSIPFLENAESLNITIEPEGGSDHPTLTNVLASQVI